MIYLWIDARGGSRLCMLEFRFWLHPPLGLSFSLQEFTALN